MTLYHALLSTHVIVAILGTGQLLAVASLARRGESSSLLELLRNVRIALVLLFATGAALDFRANGIWHEHWWFRASALLLVLTAFFAWRTQRAIRAQRLAGAQWQVWLMCANIAIATVLMEWKPL